MAVDAIIFDFDGIIIDTETPDMEVWQEFYRSKGLDLPVSLWMRRVGYNEGDAFNPATHYEQLTGIRLDEAFLQNHFKDYVERCARQPVLPGVYNLIQQASKAGIRLAIASSSRREWVERWLRQHNLWSYFDCILTREDVNLGKPAPDLYLSAVKCLDVPAERCLAIEDSPNGMKAALAAGLRCIAVLNPLTARLERPDVTLTLESLADFDLQELLSRF
jgi:HAD superfamily hydrolase (TIGR01509 family)